MYGFTTFLIKPDAVRRQLSGAILAAVESEGFEVTKLRMVAESSRADVLAHYAEHVGRDYFKSLVDATAGRRLVAGAAVFRERPGESVERFRALMGPYSDPAPGTLRARFALNRTENAVHGSDSPASAMRELLIWFPLDSD